MDAIRKKPPRMPRGAVVVPNDNGDRIFENLSMEAVAMP